MEAPTPTSSLHRRHLTYVNVNLLRKTILFRKSLSSYYIYIITLQQIGVKISQYPNFFSGYISPCQDAIHVVNTILGLYTRIITMIRSSSNKISKS